MPCYDGGYQYEAPQPRKYNGLTGEQLEAALCGVMTVLEDAGKIGGLGVVSVPEALSRVDWKEAGITRAAVAAWWKSHKAADKARRESEERKRADAERQAMLKASALSKLTPAERNALGIK